MITLSKWDKSDKSARNNSLRLKNLLADANSTNALFQALSQVAVVSVGAYFVINGEVTSGALIAAVILNGKNHTAHHSTFFIATKIQHCKNWFC